MKCGKETMWKMIRDTILSLMNAAADLKLYHTYRVLIDLLDDLHMWEPTDIFEYNEFLSKLINMFIYIIIYHRYYNEELLSIIKQLENCVSEDYKLTIKYILDHTVKK